MNRNRRLVILEDCVAQTGGVTMVQTTELTDVRCGLCKMWRGSAREPVAECERFGGWGVNQWFGCKLFEARP